MNIGYFIDLYMPILPVCPKSTTYVTPDIILTNDRIANPELTQWFPERGDPAQLRWNGSISPTFWTP